MGMLVDGHWQDKDAVIEGGAYIRPASPLRKAREPNIVSAMQERRERFWLIASWSCPWSHRTIITHKLKALDDLIPVHFAHGRRIQGYALAGGATWNVPGTSKTICHLHELYQLHDDHYTGRVTVPVLWDSKNLTIVSNESTDIILGFDSISQSHGSDFTLRPPELVEEIDAANERIYSSLNNAVYRAGFAESQEAYDEAVALVFDTLDRLEEHLTNSRYYFGSTLTETDIRLFPTLVRFDAIYYILFKCSRRRIIDYPSLWNYARDLYSWRGFAETVNFDTMRKASYLADASDAHPLVAIAPDADWAAPHNRAAISVAQITLRTSERVTLDPSSLLTSTGFSAR